jgi:hypothetical protein
MRARSQHRAASSNVVLDLRNAGFDPEPTMLRHLFAMQIAA